MYYKLNENYILRGWEKLPYALVDTKTGHSEFLNYEQFQAMKYCNGKVDLSLPIIDDDMREFLNQAEQKGIISACSEGEGISEFQEYREYRTRYISSAQWSITGKCNYKCRHCYMSAPEANAPELSHKDIMKIVDELAECGVMAVQLTGGEPLIRRDFLEIVDALLERKIAIQQIYTNGALVNEKLLRELDNRKIHPEFNMSYDGSGWHDWLRGIPGAEERVNNAFRLCRDMGFPTGAEMAIHLGNKHTIRESINHLASLGVTHIKISHAAKIGEWAKHSEDKNITLHELFQTYLDYIPYYYADGMPMRVLLASFFLATPKIPDKYMIVGYNESYSPDNFVCGHARTSTYISPEGRALLCIPVSGMKFAENFPLITEHSLSKCLNSQEYLRLAKMNVSEFINSSAKCRACKFSRHCTGGCLAIGYMCDEDGETRPSCEMFYGGWIRKIIDTVREARPSAIAPVIEEL